MIRASRRHVCFQRVESSVDSTSIPHQALTVRSPKASWPSYCARLLGTFILTSQTTQIEWKTRYTVQNNTAIRSFHANVFEPVRSTILFEKKIFPIRKLARLAAFAFRRFRAVEIRNMLITDIAEPRDAIVSLLFPLVYRNPRTGSSCAYQ